MKANYDAKRHAPILRDALVQTKPHVLERPKRLADVPPSNVQRRIEVPLASHVALAPNASFSSELKLNAFSSPLTPTQTGAPADRYQEGVEFGKNEGLNLGREQGIKEGRAAAFKEFEAQIEQERKRIFEEAYKEGLAQGLHQGEKQGLLEAEKELSVHKQKIDAEFAKLHQENIQRFNTWSNTLMRDFESLLGDIEDDMIELCFGVIAKIVGEQAVTRDGLSNLIQQQCRSFLQSAARVGVHPNDFQMFAKANAKFGDPISEFEFRLRDGLTIYAEPAVEVGGALLNNQKLTVDARLEVQLKKVVDALIDARACNARDALESRNNG